MYVACDHVCFLCVSCILCKSMYPGGLLAFTDLHPLLCEEVMTGQPRAVATYASATMVTPGACEDLLAWQTAPPVCIQPYLVLGNERDAMSVECINSFGIEYVLNVTEKCPNFFEGDPNFNIKYLRIPASDTGRMKLSDFFEEAYEFVSKWLVCVCVCVRACVRVHACAYKHACSHASERVYLPLFVPTKGAILYPSFLLFTLQAKLVFASPVFSFTAWQESLDPSPSQLPIS